MSDGRPHLRSSATRGREKGTAAVEFALVAVFLFLLMFGILELARFMYACNTLQEVTRRAAGLAAHTDYTDASAMQRVREQAVFRDSPGPLPFAAPVADDSIRIDYLAIRKTGVALALAPIPGDAMPATPRANFANCLRDLCGSDCIRLVRVRVCEPGDTTTCRPVAYRTLFSMIPLAVGLPESTTIVYAEGLGLPAGLPAER